MNDKTGYQWAIEEGGRLKRENDQLRARNENLLAERKEMVAALEATYDALDGLYGADRGEPIPYDSLTPDRQAAFNRALELVHGVMHKTADRG